MCLAFTSLGNLTERKSPGCNVRLMWWFTIQATFALWFALCGKNMKAGRLPEANKQCGDFTLKCSSSECVKRFHQSHQRLKKKKAGGFARRSLVYKREWKDSHMSEQDRSTPFPFYCFLILKSIILSHRGQSPLQWDLPPRAALLPPWAKQAPLQKEWKHPSCLRQPTNRHVHRKDLLPGAADPRGAGRGGCARGHPDSTRVWFSALPARCRGCWHRDLL